MNVELLAERLVAYSEQHDWQDDLVVRAGPGRDLYFRFSGSEIDSVRTMSWEARPDAVGSGDPQDPVAGWLTRMDFRRNGDWLVSRSVGMPMTIGDARLMAALAVFLIRRTYCVRPEHLVSAALETRPPNLPQLVC